MCMALLKAGDHIVCSDSVFGSTIALINRYMVKFGVEVTYVRPDDNEAWRARDPRQHALAFLETPSNPLSAIADIRALADIAHERGVLLAVDNCFCTPALQKPFELGADLVIHSATKYLDGQGRCVGGAVVGNEELVGKRRVRLHPLGRSEHEPVQRLGVPERPGNAGAAHARAFRSGAGARALAGGQPGVRKVHYAGLESHPQHALAQRQQSAFGGIIAFEVGNGRAGAWAFIDATRLMSITANLGDAKTTITHPASTTHSRITAGRARARRHHGRAAAHLRRSRTPRRSQGGHLERGLASGARLKVRAICFDLDNTLWDVWPVIMRAEQAMYDFLAERYPRVVARMTIEMMRAAREQTAAAHPQMRHDFTFLRKQTLREHAREFGYAEAMVEEAFEAFIQARNEVELYDGRAAGARTAARRASGCSPPATAMPTWARSASRTSSSAAIAARHVGALKPDPVIFHKVIEGTDLQARKSSTWATTRRWTSRGRAAPVCSRSGSTARVAEWPPQIAPAGPSQCGRWTELVRTPVSVAYTVTYTRSQLRAAA